MVHNHDAHVYLYLRGYAIDDHDILHGFTFLATHVILHDFPIHDLLDLNLNPALEAQAVEF